MRALASAAGDALIKVIVTRGEAVARGYAWSGTEVATRLVFQYPLPPDDAVALKEGIRAKVARLRYGENERLAGMKHLNRLEQVLARSEAPANEAAEFAGVQQLGPSGVGHDEQRVHRAGWTAAHAAC